MGYVLTIHRDEGDITLPFEGAELDRSVGEMDTMRATTPAPPTTAASIEEYQDEATLASNGVSLFAGVVSDVSTDGGRSEVLVDSYERYARDAEPCGAKYNFYDVSDSYIITDAIGDTPGLTAGTVEHSCPKWRLDSTTLRQPTECA